MAAQLEEFHKKMKATKGLRTYNYEYISGGRRTTGSVRAKNSNQVLARITPAPLRGTNITITGRTKKDRRVVVA
jgi:hypothetical protein